MSKVNYQMREAPRGDYNMPYPDHCRKLIASGTLNLDDTISSAVRILAMANAAGPAVRFRVAGPDQAYIITAGRGVSPTRTGDHAYADENPRIMLEAADGFQAVPFPLEGAFAVAAAAAVE